MTEKKEDKENESNAQTVASATTRDVENKEKKTALTSTHVVTEEIKLEESELTTHADLLENFDWDAFGVGKGFGDGYSREERESMQKIYDADDRTTINEGELVKGIVLDIKQNDVIFDIGFKSDGLIPLSEFRDMPDFKIGDEVDLFVEERENELGQLVLSRKKAKLVKSWEDVQNAHDNEKILQGFVRRRTKGGLIVEVCSIEAFLPGSQVDVKPVRNFDAYVNKTIEVKIVKINHANNNIVVSHKILVEKDIERQKAEILNNLDRGQVLEGTIKNMTDFGVFIDLGGVDGLLHITDISWERVNHPKEVLKLDQVIKVVVLSFDDSKERISLGMKQLTPHPWDKLPKEIDEGTKVKGKIVNVADYGAFLEIQHGVEGLIHVSEMSWSQHLRNPQDFIKVGDELEAIVLTINRESHKMSLGIKQLTEDPWTRQNILTKYAPQTKHVGVVRNLTHFGLFVELEEGIDGLVHVSDLSWTKKIRHPSDFVKVGESLEVVVSELDLENRRLSLSHKHLEENPWDTFESVFERGSIYPCMVLSVSDKNAILELPYGVEGFCFIKNAEKQDGSRIKVGEKLDFKVLDISKEEKRIVLSHKDVWSKEKSDAPTKKRIKQTKSSNERTLRMINESSEKSTLSDIESLSELKKQMTDSEKDSSLDEDQQNDKKSGN